MALFLMGLGIICIVYYMCVGLMAGHGTNFYYIWLLMGIAFLLWGILWKRGIIKKLPGWIRKLTLIGVILTGCLILFVEALITSKCFEKGKSDLDYIVVLGTYLRTTGPSTVLQYRLDEAYEYYLDNLDLTARHLMKDEEFSKDDTGNPYGSAIICFRQHFPDICSGRSHCIDGGIETGHASQGNAYNRHVDNYAQRAD